MQPSSLIFLVVIAIWAVYFVQHWVRRREHLATARSVDRFSESMRVLERRSALPTADLSAPAPRSYAVSPARAVRPQVTVKRAAASGPADDGRPAVGRSAVGRAAGRAAVGGAAVGRAASPRVRGLTLLGSLAATVVALALTALSVLPWWSLLVPLAAVAAAFAWVRQGVRAQTIARRGAPVGRRAAPRARRAAPRARSGARTEPVSSQPAGPAYPGVPGKGDEEPLTGAVPGAERVFDGAAAVASARSAPASGGNDSAAEFQEAPVGSAGPAMVMARLVDEDDIPLTWDPVPVPRPTYTMKARAERPQAAPAEVTPAPHREQAAYEPEPFRATGA